MIYELKIELFNVDTPPYRYVQVQSDISFKQLHFIIQVLFNWSGVQSHAFIQHKPEKSKVIGKKRLRNHPGFSYLKDWSIFEEKEEKLDDWMTDAHDTMVYEYYEYESENWLHNIELVGIYKNENDFNNKELSYEENSNLPPFDERIFPLCTNARYLSPFESFVTRMKNLKKSPTPSAIEFDEMDDFFNDELLFEDFLTKKMREKIPIISAPYIHQSMYYYDKMLETAQRYYYARPWEGIDESQIFVIRDPETEKQLFISINGADGKAPGINVFVGEKSFVNIYQSSMYYEMTESAQDTLAKLKKFHGLGLLLYGDISSQDVNYFFNGPADDRYNLENEDLTDDFFRYIDPYFFSISQQNNGYPSSLSIEEMRWMILALEETLEVYEQIQKGLDLPKVWESNALLERAYSDRYKQFINQEIRIYFK